MKWNERSKKEKKLETCFFLNALDWFSQYFPISRIFATFMCNRMEKRVVFFSCVIYCNMHFFPSIISYSNAKSNSINMSECTLHMSMTLLFPSFSISFVKRTSFFYAEIEYACSDSNYFYCFGKEELDS